MEFFDSTKSIVENLYLLSGPILTLLAVAGVIQLFLTKRTLVISSKRDAANLSAQQLKDYSERIIPTMTKYDFSLRKDKLQTVNIEISDFDVNYLIEKLGEEKVREIRLERMKYLVNQLNALNALESFSTYFTKGIADEQIAYSAIGRSFCFTIEHYFFEISCCRNSKVNDKSFQNTIDLYNMWKSRLKKEILTKEQEEILKRLNNINDEVINPIGTK
jgi:hypothetical protein